MKPKFLIFSILMITMIFISCHDEQKQTDIGDNLDAIRSIEASFAEGDYKLELDPNAVFRKLVEKDETDIIIEIPWFYPENSYNETVIDKMKLSAFLANNCELSPVLTIVDLNKRNEYKLKLPNGSVKNITISGERYKLRGCDITFFMAVDEARDISITASIDNATNQITLISAEDLSTMNINVSVSPHATLEIDTENVIFNLNEPLELTVVAQDGITKKTYRVVKEVPNKYPYGVVPGSDVLLWNINPTDIGLPWGTSQTTLASIGNYLIISDGTGSAPIYINRLTGEKLGTINKGNAVATGCVANDDNGNLIISNTANSGEILNIYRTKSVTEAPTLYLSYLNNSSLPISRILIQGDLDNDAQIVATCDGISGVTSSSSIVRWTVKAGVIGQPEKVTFSGVNDWGEGENDTQVAPLSSNVDDGYFTSAYSANTVYYVDGVTNVGTSTVYETSGDSWGLNLNRLYVSDFNKAKYLALSEASFFPQWGMRGNVYLLDVTNLSILSGGIATSPALAFKTTMKDNNSGYDGLSANGDVLLVPSSNGYYLYLYFWDNNQKIIGGYSFNCIEK